MFIIKYPLLFVSMKFPVSSIKTVTMAKHVGVKELKYTLTVHCVFVGAIKCLMYQMHAMNAVKAITI